MAQCATFGFDFKLKGIRGSDTGLFLIRKDCGRRQYPQHLLWCSWYESPKRADKWQIESKHP